MLTSNREAKPAEITWDQRLLRNSSRQRNALRPEYQELKFTLHRKLLDKINLEALASIDNQRVRSEVRQAVISLLDGEPTLLSSLERQQISEEVLDEVFGLGPLEPLLQDPGISDILVNGHKQVYVERKGLLELTNVCFRDDGHLLRIIDKIVSQVGRRVDESNPMVDARLSDGSRVNAIVPPLAVDGPLLSIRRFGTDKLMPQDLVEKHALMPGIMELLDRYHIPIEGSRAVVLGRSRTVGLPMALLLLHRNATVTICHSRTQNLAAVTREADILIAAIGRMAMVDASFIKPGAVVVDVGTSKVTDREDLERLFGDNPKKRAAFEKNGSVLVGDVNPKEAAEVAGYLSPVPGGVGPLTIAMLMKNTLTAMKLRRG